MLLLIGILLTPVPYVDFVGDILILVGAILVIIGRNAFGPIHARNTIWSIIIFVIGVVIIIAGSVVFALAVASATISGLNGGTVNATSISQALSSSFDTLLIFAIIGGGIGGIAEVLFTYALQKQTGQILLWIGYAAALTVSIVNFVIVSPLVSNAAAQSFPNGVYDPTPFANLQSQLQVLGLLAFIPAMIFASAVYLAWSRVKNNEIPGAAQ